MMDAQKFEIALDTFIAGCLRISEDHRAKHYPNVPKITMDHTRGKRYVRVIIGDESGVQRSVHCFVDRDSGDVLKAAGWHQPAKHARGNIFDEHNGLGSMGEYGPAYLR
jgi:23S rRNA A2030 N6-methylase RlmJ